jgi:hypothetical protein
VSSYSYINSTTFTITHARHIAAKIATDLKRVQRFYGKPSDVDIAAYEGEAVALMHAGYLKEVTYGFKKGGSWIEPTLRYTATQLGLAGGDDDPGRIRPGADVSGASFGSFLTYTDSWSSLSSAEREAFEKSLPLYRNTAAEPGISGYVTQDKSYSAGGLTLNRSTIRSF